MWRIEDMNVAIPPQVLQHSHVGGALGAFTPTPSGTILVPDLKAIFLGKSDPRQLIAPVLLGPQNAPWVRQFARECIRSATVMIPSDETRDDADPSSLDDAYMDGVAAMIRPGLETGNFRFRYPLTATAHQYAIAENSANTVDIAHLQGNEIQFEYVERSESVVIVSNWQNDFGSIYQSVSIDRNDQVKTLFYFFTYKKDGAALHGLRQALTRVKRTPLAQVALDVTNEIYWSNQIRASDWKGDPQLEFGGTPVALKREGGKFVPVEKLSDRREVCFCSEGSLSDRDSDEHGMRLVEIETQKSRGLWVYLRRPAGKGLMGLNPTVRAILWDPLWKSFVV